MYPELHWMDGLTRGVPVPETEEQRAWVEALASELTAHPLARE